MSNVIERLKDDIDRNMHQYIMNRKTDPKCAMTRLRLADQAARQLALLTDWWKDEMEYNPQ